MKSTNLYSKGVYFQCQLVKGDLSSIFVKLNTPNWRQVINILKQQCCQGKLLIILAMVIIRGFLAITSLNYHLILHHIIIR